MPVMKSEMHCEVEVDCACDIIRQKKVHPLYPKGLVDLMFNLSFLNEIS